jgi:ABC-type nitrate/sulfonate/bicarbonate transport system substrate-binding protein
MISCPDFRRGRAAGSGNKNDETKMMRDLWSRRRFSAAAFGGLGAAMVGASAQAATRLRVGKAIAVSIAFAPVDIGVQRGVFQTLGLNLEITNFNGGAKMDQAIVAGAVDIGLGSGPDFVALMRGLPAKVVATIVRAPAYLVVLARPGIHSIAELKGKTVSVASFASMTGWLGNKLWQAQGWQKSDIHFTVLPPTTALALLRTGQIDAIVTDGTFGLSAQEHGYANVIYNFGTMVPVFPTHLIFASNALLSRNPAAVRAFVAGWFQTIKIMRDDRAGTIKQLGDILGLDNKVATESYDDFMPIFATNGTFSAPALAVLAKSLVDMHYLPSEPTNLMQYCTSAFLPTA